MAINVDLSCIVTDVFGRRWHEFIVSTKRDGLQRQTKILGAWGGGSKSLSEEAHELREKLGKEIIPDYDPARDKSFAKVFGVLGLETRVSIPSYQRAQVMQGFFYDVANSLFESGEGSIRIGEKMMGETALGGLCNLLTPPPVAYDPEIEIKDRSKTVELTYDRCRGLYLFSAEFSDGSAKELRKLSKRTGMDRGGLQMLDELGRAIFPVYDAAHDRDFKKLFRKLAGLNIPVGFATAHYAQLMRDYMQVIYAHMSRAGLGSIHSGKVTLQKGTVESIRSKICSRHYPNN